MTVRELARRIWHRMNRFRRRGGFLEGVSPEIRLVFREDVRVECVATGMSFAEGPVWVAEGRYLLFSDIPGDTIYRLGARKRTTVFHHPSGNANGLARYVDGSLLLCEHRGRRVTQMRADGSLRVVADAFGGKRLNSPNDVVVRSDGTIYFTDPSFGIDPAGQEQPIRGVYMVSLPAGEITLAAGDLEMPNGLAFSPDEKMLYIDDSARNHVRRFTVLPDGRLTGGEVVCEMRGLEGMADGMKADSQGNIFCAGPGGVWVLNASGRHLGTLFLPERPSNCAFGDGDLRSLYITAGSSVYRARVEVPGAILPGGAG